MSPRTIDNDDDLADHVSAGYVARKLGRDWRTIVAWIRTERIAGGYVPPSDGMHRGTWYVHRSAFLALRDKKKKPREL